MAGRTTSYTDELGQRIAYHISSKTIGLKHIVSLPDIDLNIDTVRAWIADRTHPFSDIYRHAKEAQLELLAEETLDIADDGSNDLMTIVKGDVTYEQENKEVASRSKLRVDTRKWLLSKLNPKKYGDKIEVDNKMSGSVQITGISIQPIEVKEREEDEYSETN